MPLAFDRTLATSGTAVEFHCNGTKICSIDVAALLSFSLSSAVVPLTRFFFQTFQILDVYLCCVDRVIESNSLSMAVVGGLTGFCH